MNTTEIQQNAQVLTRELEWLSEVIEVRLALHFEQDTSYASIYELPVPDCDGRAGSYAAFVQKNKLNAAERLVLALALVPHLKPGLLDVLLTRNHDYGRRYSEFGGLLIDGHPGLIPTAETAMFILAGDNLHTRISHQFIFRPEHLFTAAGVIKGAAPKKSTPRLSGNWMVTDEYIDYFVCGEPYIPVYSEDFPAQRIATEMEWTDIVLSKKTKESLEEIREWVVHAPVIMNDLGLSRRLKPGFKSLFYGPPGTGKTLTAALLGKSTHKPVYKIDLSMVVSKYIGETEKNLAKVFNHAEQQDWILFFDEADALFGKRTQVNTANDRYGNQEIGYLLQRIEEFPGVVILASNLKENIDEAFTRRFQSMVEFRMPGVAERYQLWQQSFAPGLPLDGSIDTWALAKKYELSGGLMMNVVRKSTLRAVAGGLPTVTQKLLEEAIQQELHKEGIILN